jgi:hypothetical protein
MSFRLYDFNVAQRIGVVDAIILNEIHHHVRPSPGDEWVSNSLSGWHELLPEFSCDIIKRTFKSLEEAGYIKTRAYECKVYDGIIYGEINLIFAALGRHESIPVVLAMTELGYDMIDGGGSTDDCGQLKVNWGWSFDP